MLLFTYLVCGHVHASVLMWRSEDGLWKPVLFFCHVGLSGQIQASTLDSKHIYLTAEPSLFNPMPPALHMCICEGAFVHACTYVEAGWESLVLFLRRFPPQFLNFLVYVHCCFASMHVSVRVLHPWELGL